jgi:hypothetical protein
MSLWIAEANDTSQEFTDFIDAISTIQFGCITSPNARLLDGDGRVKEQSIPPEEDAFVGDDTGKDGPTFSWPAEKAFSEKLCQSSSKLRVWLLLMFEFIMLHLFSSCYELYSQSSCLVPRKKGKW